MWRNTPRYLKNIIHDQYPPFFAHPFFLFLPCPPHPSRQFLPKIPSFWHLKSTLSSRVKATCKGWVLGTVLDGVAPQEKGKSLFFWRTRKGENMTGRPGYRTMEMIGASSALYLARAPCIPLFSTLLNRGGGRRVFRLPGLGADHFHCTVEPSPGHMWCRNSYSWGIYLVFAGSFFDLLLQREFRCRVGTN